MRDLPNVNDWLPYKDHEAWLKNAFIEQCINSEKTILSKLDFEKKTSVFPFSSGISLEEIILQEFSKLFPKRYLITNGYLSDNKGYTAGDCDVIFFNDLWFPHVLSAVSDTARKKFLPIDGTYAVGEIKSTLSIDTLDNACEKLIKCSRLSRTLTSNNRLVENRESGCFHGTTNPPYTFIVAAKIEDGITFETLIDRFFDINKQVKRLEVIRTLCVLGHGVVTWAYRDDSDQGNQALFMNDDLYKPIYPVYIPYNEKFSTIYTFIQNLQLHLYNSVLAPEDFALHYGNNEFNTKSPDSPDVCLQPDQEWLEKLNTICIDGHNIELK